MTESTDSRDWATPVVEPLPQVTDAALGSFGSGTDMTIYSSFI